MLRRTSKNFSSMTPKSSDRSDRMETTTTITPRERPKIPGRAASQGPIQINSAQRRLIPGEHQVFNYKSVAVSVS